MGRGLRTARRQAVWLVSVSAIALAVASADVHAADLPPRKVIKGPLYIPKDEWSWWLEGGLIQRPNDLQVGFGPALGQINAGPGYEAAIGFDVKPALSPYHFSGQFRYGRNREQTAALSGNPFPITFLTTAFLPALGTLPAIVNAQGVSRIKENHWLADFAVGRDFALGSSMVVTKDPVFVPTGQVQVKLGIRIAELKSESSAAGALAGCLTSLPAALCGATPVIGQVSFQSRSSFLGVGPRLGFDGSQRLGGSWTLDYLAGAAVLFGRRSIDALQFLTATTTFPFALPLNQISALSASSNAAIFNLDAQVGLSYWLTQNFKLTASFRFDGYWNALPVINSGGVTNENRFYYGPMLRATANF
jgi:hypothetical protein